MSLSTFGTGQEFLNLLFETVNIESLNKLGTLGDRPTPLTIQLDSDLSVGCQCHQVTDTDFAVSDRQYNRYHTNANDVT